MNARNLVKSLEATSDMPTQVPSTICCLPPAAMDTTDAPQLIEHVSRSLAFTPNDTKWLPCSARFVCMGIYPKATGALTVFALDQGELRTIAELEKPHGVKCGTFGASALEDRHLATGDYSGVMSIWFVPRRI